MWKSGNGERDRSGQPDVVMGQSIVLSDIKTEVLLENDDPALSKTFYCIDMKSELKGFQRLIKRVHFAWMQDFQVLLKLDSIS